MDSNIKIKVVGIGGAGGNTISRLSKYKIEGVDLIIINTDSQDLKKVQADFKIQIGNKITKGLGTGMNPGNGLRAAKESSEDIKNLLIGTDMVFITGGFGGGTCSGAAPIVADIAKSQGALTIAVITKPFSFEGAQRAKIAKSALKNLEDKVDALISISNNRLVKLANEKTTLDYSFSTGDKILREAILGICDLILKPGIINVDFAAIKTILKNSGRALIAQGQAKGENRAIRAAKEALSSSLLDFSPKGAKGILFNIAGKDLSLSEIKEAANTICQNVNKSAKIIFGAREDKKLEKGVIKIMLIATGF